MTAATLRASYSISAPTLSRFNAVVPPGERSRVVEAFMLQALAAKEVQLEHMAEAYLSDPAFAQCRADTDAWDVAAADGLEPS